VYIQDSKAKKTTHKMHHMSL